MEFIGAYWWLWLVLMLVFETYAAYNQIKRIREFADKGLPEDVDGAGGSFLSGIGSFILAGALTAVFGLLLVLSIIINLIEYFSR